ncbi:hypothetical protein JOE44_002673 [Chryseobacterium sp. PvR013]|nr:hypothetical protein [Chryseobacterium sp. PvR013]
MNSNKKRISIGESIDLKDWNKKNGLAIGKGDKDLNSKLINERSGLDKYLRNANLPRVPLTFRLVDDYFKKLITIWIYIKKYFTTPFVVSSY